jgi:hypothetical protein
MNADRNEQKRLRKETSGVVLSGKGTHDPTLAPLVLARSGVLRERPIFDRAAFWVPVAWIGWFVARSLYRLIVDGSLGGAARGIVPIVICVLALLGRRGTQWQRERAITSYEETAQAIADES